MFHNLLPEQEKRAVLIEFRFRYAVVVALLLTSACVIGFVSLLPVYFNVRSEVDALSSRVQGGEHATTSPEVMKDLETINAVAETMQLFESTLTDRSVTELVRVALEARSSAISIEGIAYDRERATLVLDGTADSRNALVEYTSSLEGTGLFGEVQLSISDLAKNTNIHFQLPLSLVSKTKP